MNSSQEIFEFIARHLFTQGKRATDDRGVKCRYRSADGCKCAIGALIKDEIYSPELEGCCVLSVDVREALRDSGMSDYVIYVMLPMLPILQQVHDNPDNWQSTQTMQDALDQVAKIFNLDMTSVSDMKFNDR